MLYCALNRIYILMRASDVAVLVFLKKRRAELYAIKEGWNRYGNRESVQERGREINNYC